MQFINSQLNGKFITRSTPHHTETYRLADLNITTTKHKAQCPKMDRSNYLPEAESCGKKTD